jgi:hypothetical protein
MQDDHVNAGHVNSVRGAAARLGERDYGGARMSRTVALLAVVALLCVVCVVGDVIPYEGNPYEVQCGLPNQPPPPPRMLACMIDMRRRRAAAAVAASARCRSWVWSAPQQQQRSRKLTGSW